MSEKSLNGSGLVVSYFFGDGEIFVVENAQHVPKSGDEISINASNYIVCKLYYVVDANHIIIDVDKA